MATINDIRAAIRSQNGINVLDAIGILDSLSSALAVYHRKSNDADADQLIKWIDDAIETCTPGVEDPVEVLQAMKADAWIQARKDGAL